ncbi:uncharacterized protein FIBRA_03462 [Fibroporia radiculosa]|uniref:C2 domain-containing protein n=1 Tax=Fibroporia radiculosa TaxID=599839 RepID=J4I9M3_9APHY|nr:uncharacterized protein FIBRA_03462 [Fibroporia radiculosa]CCM01411.1 predicted protein [Fibroporia radiculosa]
MNKELGTLVVVVLKAKNLPDKHLIYKQDVFAQATIHGKTKKTEVDVKGGQHPLWDEELRFPIFRSTSQEDRTLEISCWRKEPGADEIIGKGKVDISETLRTGEFDGKFLGFPTYSVLTPSSVDWVQLEVDQLYRGEIYLEMTYFAAGPAPLQRRPTKMLISERLQRQTQPYAYSNLKTPSKIPSTPISPPHTPTAPAPVRASLAPVIQAGQHLSAPSNHMSPRGSPRSSPHTSPRSRNDALPPIPQERVAPDSIPDMLRPGNPKSHVHYSEKPHPPGYGAQVRLSSPPPHSPHRTSMVVSPQSSPPFAYPAASRSYPPRDQPSPGLGQRAHNLLSSENPMHSRYSASPPRTPPHAYVHATASSRPTPPTRVDSSQIVHPFIYTHAPPPAMPEVEITSSPALTARYSAPLPLPDEPEGMHTSTPGHPHLCLSISEPRRPAPAPRHLVVANRRDSDVQANDEELAKKLEDEEKRRQREEAERECEDLELALRLDLELNLQHDEEVVRTGTRSPAGSARPRSIESLSPTQVPGSW